MQQVRIIFLACGPEHLEKVASELRPVLKPTIVVVSMLAGVTLAKLAQVLQVPHPVRAVHTRPAIGIAPVCAETFLRHSKSARRPSSSATVTTRPEGWEEEQQHKEEQAQG